MGPAALDNFLSLIYTGSLGEAHLEKEGRDAVIDLIETAELAHRYQIESFHEALALRLCGRISLESFEDASAFALRCRHEQLKKSCLNFAREHKATSNFQAWQTWVDSLSPQVRQFIMVMDDAQQTSKRRR